jgi:RND family efflux transporter MFP subunit
MFRARSLAVVLAVLTAAPLVLSGCSLLPVEEEALQPPLVEPAREPLDYTVASRGTIETYLRGTAHFVSSRVETLSFKESGGRLKSIHVALGDHVEAGEPVAELEVGDLELQVELQRLNVERARLLYKEARASGADAVDFRLREIDLEREQKMLEAMETRLGKARLHAPISGTVIFVASLKEGDTVGAFQPIVTIADPDSVQLTYVAAESKELFGLEVGMPAFVKYKGVEYTGKVLQTPSSAPLTSDPAAAERNGVTIVVGIDDPPGDVQIGHSADLTIPLQKRENVIVLPRSAIRSYMGRNYVQVAEGERLKEVDIETGLTTPTEVEIVKGLEEGQTVVLNH